MNIHEYQAKEILRQFGVAIPNGVVILNLEDGMARVINGNSQLFNLSANLSLCVLSFLSIRDIT